MTALTDELRRLREEAGLTQRDLAERTGLSQVNLSRYESGIKQPTLRTAQAITRALGVSLAVFDSAMIPDKRPEKESKEKS